MGPGEVTSSEAVLRAIGEYDRLGRDAFLAKYGFKKARKFVLIHNGIEYDSKPLLAAAYGFQYPEAGPLPASTFKGGNPTVSRLRALGFTVSHASASSSDVRFGQDDCRLFEKYPERVHWRDENVSSEDQAAFKDIWQRLKQMADWLAENARMDVVLQPFVSAYQANGYSQKDIWCCVFPADVPNKSYGLQVAFIISAGGAEICICLGAGASQIRGLGLAAAQHVLEELRTRLSSVPASVVDALEKELPSGAVYRTSWRQQPGASDFPSIAKWLSYAATPQGAKASISLYLTPDELDQAGSRIGDEFLQLADAAAPLFEYCYVEQTPEAGTADRPDDASENVPQVYFDSDSLSMLASGPPHRLEIAQGVYQAIIAAINSGKHVILTGPPGTAKTTLAELTCQLARDAQLCAGHTLTTATADWTTYDTIGGLRPTGTGAALKFRAGLFLEAVQERRWLVIDELNRSNFDRAFGQLFTVLSKQSVALPYEDPADNRRIVLFPEGAAGRYDPAEYSIIRIPKSWRIIATMNVFDKSLLFEMSFALMRRFAFIEVPSPSPAVFAKLWDRELGSLPGDQHNTISQVLQGLLELGSVKDIGPAVFIDMARFSRQYLKENPAATAAELAFQLFYSYLLPQFEGITDPQGKDLYRKVMRLVGDRYRSRLQATLADVLGTTFTASVPLRDEEEISDTEPVPPAG
jgi:MoxR-like ATPase